VTDKQQWVPFSVRQGGDVKAWNVMYEDVPAHLLPSLRRHVMQQVGNSSQLAQKIQRRLRLCVPSPSGGPIADIFAAADQDPRRYLDIADLLLNLDHEEVKRADDLTIVMDYSKRGQIKLAAFSGLVALGQILTESSSAYAVDMSGAWRMVRRVDPTAQAAIDDLVKRSTAPTDLLARAWRATFQRDPDPDAAYRDAVLAVEAVACPLFSPNDKTPTLGKAINNLTTTVDGWTVVNLDHDRQPSAETLLMMLRSIWHNHGRHVAQGGTPPEPVKQDEAEAEAVLFLAVAVVQWFERGFVRPLDS
jgi:hypothetical protein